MNINKEFIGKLILMMSLIVFVFGFTVLVDAIISDSFKRISLVIDCVMTVFLGIGVAAYLGQKDN